MCELLGMSANVPTDICFSFTGLMQRGGNTGPHSDGWGITFYEGKGFRTFKDPNPSCQSRIAELVQQYPIKSRAVVSHIRQANRGGVNLENTHPFTREVWGNYWTFAHNGQLTGYEQLTVGRNQAVGDTDSEIAFCWLMNQLEIRFPVLPVDMTPVFGYFAECCDTLRQLGVYNMLLSNGEYVLTYCTNKLHWITRRAPFGKASLIDEDVTIDFQRETTANDVVTVIATQPLTNDESWQKMVSGEFRVFHLGETVYHSVATDVSLHE
ncbi:class II glutamine amidotransferase [Photobacterium phosphoreum]|jgi:glutamine amidotransferase|uniref:Class II glutamine amidotransferase n=1 Tax=Photobacterium phosphoreum TaxID=659 RepID=A0AAW5A2A1_PHOPO|nr:class II glutamine amidotransferase [Photobacterium phosphoreum]KJF85616.1 glutamine amidotransferase [Photobacterium phosphoreum]MCD9465175.1 class II glutamine amidotransferase [Photobacterium phosphoreum]MCD9472706.1 class II glutamine amidotransferase [Photobacterium phosphoreum]MCD9481245.1 class II glutamine amidotransferase [Photobacterium phosphoreum]MCD9485197.1 class II glutamine amidotransferase [Photobacterium phosphoreum]